MSAYVFSQAYYQDSNPNQHYIKKEDARDWLLFKYVESISESI